MDSGAGANPREIALRLRRNSVGEMPDSRELESRSEMQGRGATSRNGRFRKTCWFGGALRARESPSSLDSDALRA